MLPLQLAMPADRPLSVVAIGAHPDDIEIGAGGLLLALAPLAPKVRYVLMTGTADRQDEARSAVHEFLPSADVEFDLFSLPEGRLPAAWDTVKSVLEEIARSGTYELVLAPHIGDAHQDHRTIGELVPTVFRDHLCLTYEIPKWDGDMGRPSIYLPMTEDAGRRKVELLTKCYPSQHARDWWDTETFLGLARLRGMECRAKYAEAFHVAKAVLLSPRP